MKSFVVVFLLIIAANNAISQAASYSDPAQAYVKLLLEKSETAKQQIGGFKVLGSSLLYGGNLPGDVYFKNGHAKNVLIDYDTYRQVLSLNTGNDGKGLIKQLNEMDSFILRSNEKTEYKNDLKFINVGQYDSSKKVFLQIVSEGKRFNLYKAYKSDLGYATGNYIQSDLRQFDLNYEYYYTDTKAPGLKKLKVNEKALKKEFKDVKDVSPAIESTSLSSNPELSLIKLFGYLNI